MKTLLSLVKACFHCLQGEKLFALELFLLTLYQYQLVLTSTLGPQESLRKK